MRQFYSGWKQLTSGSVSRQIFGAVILVGLSTMLVKFTAFIKDAVVAWRFGTGDDLDAFLIALLVPSFVITVVSESLNSALIPTFIQVREQHGQPTARKLFSSAMVGGIVILIATAVLMAATAPTYLTWIARGFSADKLQLTLHLLWVITPSVLLSGIITMWSAILNAGEKFMAAALCPIITPLLTIGLMLIFPAWGIFAFALGIVLGDAAQIFILGYALRQRKILVMPQWHGLDKHVRQVLGQYIPMVGGSLLFSSANFVDQTMAAMMMPGSVASLNYGNRLTAVIVGLTTTAISAAVIPYFSKMIAHHQWHNVKRTLKQYLGLIFATTIPLTGFLLINSAWIISLLFERGAFLSSDTSLVAQIQICFALQIPFHVANILMVRLISSMQMNHILLWTSGSSPLLNIGFNYLFIQFFGIKGIAISTSCIYCLTFIGIFCFIRHSLNQRIKAS